MRVSREEWNSLDLRTHELLISVVVIAMTRARKRSGAEERKI